MTWIPVETLPTNEGKYLVCCGTVEQLVPLVTVAWFNLDYGWTVTPSVFVGNVKYWMHIPPVPKE